MSSLQFGNTQIPRDMVIVAVSGDGIRHTRIPHKSNIRMNIVTVLACKDGIRRTRIPHNFSSIMNCTVIAVASKNEQFGNTQIPPNTVNVAASKDCTEIHESRKRVA